MTNMPVKKQLLGLIAWLIVSFSVSALGAIASIQAKSFYATLVQPSWAPPAWLFGPVWTTLFIIMAISAWLVWRSDRQPNTRIALALYSAQLAVNALWSWLFFAWHLGGFAFIDILILDILIAATMVRFWQISKVSALLFIPYALWVAFATFLNYAVWQLNPALLG